MVLNIKYDSHGITGLIGITLYCYPSMIETAKELLKSTARKRYTNYNDYREIKIN